ncbi:hypothetical protein [Crossiella sp. CA198]|uniref:hypothetical protein n=1 Tax=Crossiella sp. CA198 TaxID=3455607 RepID=UPI003F8D36BE
MGWSRGGRLGAVAMSVGLLLVVAADGSGVAASRASGFGEQVLARAETWYRQNLQYSQERCYQNGIGYADIDWGGPLGGCRWPYYRTDCSGFVSMTWGLRFSYATPRPGDSPDLADVAHRIQLPQLRAGDILVADGKHVRLFERWLDYAAGRYRAYDFGSTPVKHQDYVWGAPGEHAYRPMRTNSHP